MLSCSSHRWNLTMMTMNNKKKWNLESSKYTISSSMNELEGKNLWFLVSYSIWRSKPVWTRLVPSRKNKFITWWKSSPVSVLLRSIKNWFRGSSRKSRSDSVYKSWNSSKEKDLGLWQKQMKNYNPNVKNNKKAKRKTISSMAKRYPFDI